MASSFSFKPKYFLYLGIAICLILANYLLPRVPLTQTDHSLSPMAAHINAAHGFIITENGEPAGKEPFLIVENSENQMKKISLTKKGEAVLDATDQQMLGLNGERKIEMTIDEYNLFLEKLHGLLQLKGMTAPGQK